MKNKNTNKQYDDYELKDKMISQELFAVDFTNQKNPNNPATG